MSKTEQLTQALAARGFKGAKVVWRGLQTEYDGGYHAFADDDQNLTPYLIGIPGDMIGANFQDAMDWISGCPQDHDRWPGWPGLCPAPSVWEARTDET